MRAAHLDETHAFFNGTSVFVRIEGREHAPNVVDLVAPTGKGYRDWQVATTLPEHGAPRYGFGTYRADNYDALIDHPVEMGRFAARALRRGAGCRTRSRTPAPCRASTRRASTPTWRGCATRRSASSDGARPRPRASAVRSLPVPHRGQRRRLRRARASRVDRADLLARRAAGGAREGQVGRAQQRLPDVPRPRQPRVLPQLERQAHQAGRLRAVRPVARELHVAAVDLRGLHELLRRPVPRAHRPRKRGAIPRDAGQGRRRRDGRPRPQDAERRRQLVRRVGQVLPAGRERARTRSSAITRRARWSRCVSTLPIRRKTAGKASLDDVMRLLWQRYGRDFYAGQPRTDCPRTASPRSFAKPPASTCVRKCERWAHGTDELPLAATARVVRTRVVASSRSEPGAGARRARATAAATVKLASVTTGGAAHAAGLSAGDVLVALDGLRVQPGPARRLLARYRVGDVVRVSAFRGDVLLTRTLMLAAGPRRR